MINAKKETYHPLIRILTFVSHFELFNGCHFPKRFDDLVRIMSLCHQLLASALDKELAKIYGRQNNTEASFSFARHDVILLRSLY